MQKHFLKQISILFLILLFSLFIFLFDWDSKNLKISSLIGNKESLSSDKWISKDLNFNYQYQIKLIKIKDFLIKVKVATTLEEKEKGLSIFKNIPQNEGMLFVYSNPGIYRFWMKEMKFPIDIIWIDENNKIIHIDKNVQPETYPQTFEPPKKVLYVLETNANFTDKNNIKVGDLVEIY